MAPHFWPLNSWEIRIYKNFSLCYVNDIFCYKYLQSENIHIKSFYPKNTLNIERYLEPFIPLVHHSRISGTHSVTSGAFLDEVVVCSPLAISSESRSNNPENRHLHIHYIYNKSQNHYCINSITVIMDFFMIFTMTVSPFNNFETYMYMEDLWLVVIW